MRYSVLLLLAGLIFLGSACKTTSETPPTDPEPVEAQIENGLVGTVTYIDLEGGFYGIMGEDDEKYFPINLEESHRQDGLRVRFTFRERTDIMTITMWGKTVEITAIESL